MDEPLQTYLWLGVVVSIVLTIRASISRSWLTMWVASLLLFPFVLSSVGLFTIPLAALQIAAAAALRQNAAARGWLVCIGLSLLAWVAVLFSARFTAFVWIGGIPLLPLSPLALLLPLVPIGRRRPQLATR